MQEIKCPHCGQYFTIDESGYSEIVRQIRDGEFENELAERIHQLEKAKESDIKLASAEKDRKITELEGKLEKLAAEKDAAAKNAVLELSALKDKQIAELETKLAAADSESKLAVAEAVAAKEKELVIKNEEILSLKESFETQLAGKNEIIDYYKDLKIRQSTKLLGETLEQHCEIEFNKLRATAFKDAYFEKDNDAKSGSKGDYIYREYTADGAELISIMFEMKNEADETATKHKNEDFLKKLDKDRNEKNCEYAVLVSMLEADNELYNQGIVDVSYQYPKMYVIRPQLFIPMITILKNAALNSAQYKNELAIIQNQNLDITHFEEDLEDFKDKFGRNVKLAGDRFKNAIDEIDKTITHLTKVKENLIASEKNLVLADKKLDDLTIKKLTKNNPTMAEKFGKEK